MLTALFKFAGGVVVGAAVGMAVGILLAPQSGSEFQTSLRQFRDEVIEAGKQAEEMRRQELQTLFAQAKQS